MKLNHNPMTRPPGRIAGFIWRLGDALERWPSHPTYPLIIIGGTLAALLLLSLYNL